MLCPRCGRRLVDGSRYCPFCGSSFEAQPPQDPAPEKQALAPTEPYDPRQSCDSPPPFDSYRARPVPAEAKNDPRGMKWFKFIIYFQLFANAALNIFNSLQLFTGAIYEGGAEQVYRLYPGLQAADLFYGAVCLGLAGLALLARFRLAGFRRNGPGLYYLLLTASMLGYLLYLVLASVPLRVSPAELLNDSAMLSLGFNLLMLVVNRIYFGRRQDLFVN